MKDERVYILNALWYKAEGGEERYREYMKLVAPMIEAVGGRRLKSFVPRRALEGEFDADLVYFTEFPDLKTFSEFVNSSDYHELAEIRAEALSNSIRVQCERPEKSYKVRSSHSVMVE